MSGTVSSGRNYLKFFHVKDAKKYPNLLSVYPIELHADGIFGSDYRLSKAGP